MGRRIDRLFGGGRAPRSDLAPRSGWRLAPHSFAVAGMTGLPYAIRPDVFSGCAERVSDF